MFDLRWSKAAILGLLLLLLSSGVSAQRNNPYYDNKPLHFGFLVGLNFSTVHMRLNAPAVYQNDTLRYIDPSWGPGFQLGVISDLRLNDYMTLRFTPTLMFSQRNVYYTFENPGRDTRKVVQVANVDLPLNIKWRSERINNYRIYVLSGMKYSIDMASQERVVEDVERVKLARHDIAYEVGVGLDLYLPYFKFSPELKFSQGIRNLLVPEIHQYSASLLGLQSRSIIISFNFE
jgi:hypothetical protein